ncbi:IS110 family transposase [Roseomonas eburnea]|uniref:IS110 family transposase n=1 Tax=Neoroseomonas eburnea TaxID=1346889 RepID=A0A9X9XB61_9PROT|nr:IS110 family transposase [Neoroseomonas eburnea]MBR0680947.1 IS110 family transposase [Neoroseomonas eburnea]
MLLYVGLDVSQEETEICVVDGDGRRVWRGKCPSRPEAIAETLKRHAPDAARVGMETGPLAIWLWHGLRALGTPIECLHARQVAAALSLQVNKTGANDAYGIAQVVRSGWYRAVAVKSLQSCRVRAVLAARRQLVMVRTGLYNQIRGLLKTFGVVLGAGTGGTFERAVHAQCPDDPMVRDAIGALLAAWKIAGERKAELERQLVKFAREQDVCRRLATVPGVGAITSVTFVTAIDDPTRFRRSSDVGAYLGLTPKRYQSGEVDLAGRISKSGDRMTRSLLFEAANALITRVRGDSALRRWGERLAARIGSRKAKTAVARKLATILHRMWLDGTEFVTAPAC